MFVCVARITLQIPESGSLKSKRSVVRKVSDRLKARYNVAIAEVADNDLWQRATLGLSVVGNDRRHCDEQMQKILHAVEEMYVAPVISQQTETLAFGDELFGDGQLRSLADVPMESDADDPLSTLDRALQAAKSERSMAEAEGMGEWEARQAEREAEEPERATNLEEARARARALRNPRDWEK